MKLQQELRVQCVSILCLDILNISSSLVHVCRNERNHHNDTLVFILFQCAMKRLVENCSFNCDNGSLLGYSTVNPGTGNSFSMEASNKIVCTQHTALLNHKSGVNKSTPSLSGKYFFAANKAYKKFYSQFSKSQDAVFALVQT